MGASSPRSKWSRSDESTLTEHLGFGEALEGPGVPVAIALGHQGAQRGVNGVEVAQGAHERNEGR